MCVVRRRSYVVVRCLLRVQLRQWPSCMGAAQVAHFFLRSSVLLLTNSSALYWGEGAICDADLCVLPRTTTYSLGFPLCICVTSLLVGTSFRLGF